MARAVFFDRDGVLNELVERFDPHTRSDQCKLTSPWTLDELHMYANVQSVVTSVKRLGYLAIIVTNQPGIAYGELSRETYARMCERFMALGFTAIMTCEHALESTCECRKPKPGLLFEAAQKWDISLSDSFLVGDSETDIAAADAAGCTGDTLGDAHNSLIRAKHEIGTIAHVLKFLA